MLFNSLTYLVFLPLVVAVYYTLPHRVRWVLLLGASYFFYSCWRVEYLALIVISTLVDYAAALGMERFDQKAWARRTLLWLSLSTNLGLLIYFKYLTFFAESLNTALEALVTGRQLPVLDVLLPVGISFYTFQTLSYTIDVFRRVRKPEPHLGVFALYVSYFPQLVAGPIERSTHLLPELKKEVRFDESRLVRGLSQCLWGFFQKVVVADSLAPLVNTVYADPRSSSGPAILLATYFFAFQIFCDFAGYSNIAIGSSRLLGIDLMENFRNPYFAASLSEFWRRWHISLSTWFRDYVYYSLGGSRGKLVRTCRNLMAVFVISGLWHGANWTFLVWGALHGSVLISERLWLLWRSRGGQERSLRASTAHGWQDVVWRGLGILVTFHIVLLGWVFFRAETVSDALVMLGRLGVGWGSRVADPYEIAKGLFLICFLLAGQAYAGRASEPWPRAPQLVRWAWSYLLILLLIVFGNFAEQEFIYFQF